MRTVLDRFLDYIGFDTQSNDSTGTHPSTPGQFELARHLAEELEAIGAEKVRVSEHACVTACLPATPGLEQIPPLGLIAHLDTSDAASGREIHPQIVKYTGGTIPLGKSGKTLDPARFPFLNRLTGHTLITTDGTTLLGADDKAGVAEIMSAMDRLMESGRPHGEIKVIFTTDEEVGRGAEGIDVKALGCDFGYTVDGGPIGEIEYENFNAASAVLTVHGVGVHPGEAKDVMVNAATVAIEFHDMLPKTEVPENTCGYQGFFHLHDMQGSVTEATLRYIIRDHDAKSFEARKALFLALASEINRRYGEGTAVATVKDSYYNMKEKIEPHIQLIHKAIAAFEKNGIPARTVPIRGGTDGAHLSWDGLPCPNLPTGGYNYHGVREWIPARSLDQITDVLVDLVVSFAE